MNNCFLCNPEQDLVYLENNYYFAMLGLGPIIEGYTIAATKSHNKSFFDLERKDFMSYVDFLSELKELIHPIFGLTIFTEHGRVGICQNEDIDSHESHCYHAHHLIFPLGYDIEVYLNILNLYINKYNSLIDAYDNTPIDKDYHFFSKIDGSCGVILTDYKISRQFFRKIVATMVGKLDKVDWVTFPNYELIGSAKKKLGI